jgi:hypothetical protein
VLWSFLYLILSRFFQFLVLLGRGHRAREIKILALRHQVAVLCRQVSRPDAFFMTPATFWVADERLRALFRVALHCSPSLFLLVTAR